MFTAKAATAGAARTGLLAANGAEVATPNFVVATRRGAVPHLTPDHAPAAPAAGVYAEELWDRHGLVDTVCRRSALPLRAQVLVGAARRPASRRIANKPNTDDEIAIDTAQGSHLAPLARIMDFMDALAPDVFVVPHDEPAQSGGARGGARVGGNRLRKMHARSLAWAERFAARRAAAGAPRMLVASLPRELRTHEYVRAIDELCDGYYFAGSPPSDAPIDARRLRLSDAAAASAAEPAAGAAGAAANSPTGAGAGAGARPAAGPVQWSAIVGAVAAGADLVLVPVEAFSDSGLALTLSLAADTPEYIDLNAAQYKADMTELGATGHARAYIHHMLEAREMTAQVLLQQHNMAVVEQLFSDMRSAIDANEFEAAAVRFCARYG